MQMPASQHKPSDEMTNAGALFLAVSIVIGTARIPALQASPCSFCSASFYFVGIGR